MPVPISEIVQILVAAVICWILFILVDLIFALPRKGGVSGATAIGATIKSAGGNLNGGLMMGNIVCSPDASAGTLLAACGVYIAGLPGGLFAMALVYVGNRICHDKGYAGTTGAFLATILISALTSWTVLAPEQFIAGMVLAITTIQGISHVHASRLLGILWGWRS